MLLNAVSMLFGSYSYFFWGLEKIRRIKQVNTQPLTTEITRKKAMARLCAKWTRLCAAHKSAIAKIKRKQ